MEPRGRWNPNQMGGGGGKNELLEDWIIAKTKLWDNLVTCRLSTGKFKLQKDLVIGRPRYRSLEKDETQTKWGRGGKSELWPVHVNCNLWENRVFGRPSYSSAKSEEDGNTKLKEIKATERQSLVQTELCKAKFQENLTKENRIWKKL